MFRQGPCTVTIQTIQKITGVVRRTMAMASQQPGRSGLPENWKQMTPAQKRQYRQDKFINPEGVNFVSQEAKRNYQTRAQRLVDVYNVQEPDRVPVVLQVGSMPLSLAGIDGATAMRDFEKTIEACNAFNEKHAEELETYPGPGGFPGKVMELLDYKLYAWPGHGIPEETSGMQYVEGEYMTADEYDELILDPSDFWMRKYLPRVFGTLLPFQALAPVTDIQENVHLINFAALSTPEMIDSLSKLVE